LSFVIFTTKYEAHFITLDSNSSRLEGWHFVALTMPSRYFQINVELEQLRMNPVRTYV